MKDTRKLTEVQSDMKLIEYVMGYAANRLRQFREMRPIEIDMNIKVAGLKQLIN